MVFFDSEYKEDHTMKQVKDDADNNLYILIGLINNAQMLELIPACEKFYRWNGICHGCGCDASFTVKHNNYCRECKLKNNN